MAYDILIVDDEPDIRLLIDGILADEGYETRNADGAETALAAFQARRPSLVVLDVWLQGSRLDGIGLLEMFHGEEPQIPVVMISGHGTIEMAVGAIQHGAYDFIEKPFQSDRLLLVVRRALEAAALARENAELRLRAGPEAGLIGESSSMAQIRNQVDKVSPTGSRVLITGPAGVGQGSRGADDPCEFAAGGGAVRGDELRDHGASSFRGGIGSARRSAPIRPRSQGGRGAGTGAWRNSAAG